MVQFFACKNIQLVGANIDKSLSYDCRIKQIYNKITAFRIHDQRELWPNMKYKIWPIFSKSRMAFPLNQGSFI